MRRLLRRRLACTRDEGFTLPELAVAMSIFGAMCAIGALGFNSLQKSMAENGTQREVVSVLRNAQVRAVAEATAYCMDFGGTTSTAWSLYRVPGADHGALPAGFSCSSGTKVDGPFTSQKGTRVSDVAFHQRDGSTTAWVLFYPRGAASPGSLVVRRTGSDTTYTVTVDGLTARVSSTGK